ncbi:MAG: transporter substrate-binding domain-containing protein [Arcobacteraceae bacterium]|nr:transporter substrate-binding domain-containing protein [Arcobacteraceae bacterium]
MKVVLKLILTIFLMVDFSLLANDVISQERGEEKEKLEKVSIQLQWLDQFQFAGYYIAKEKGFYKDAGFDVEIKKFAYGINTVDEVVNKKATYGTGRSSLIIDISDGTDIQLLASIFQSSPLMLLTTKHSDIKSIKDFKNKRVMHTKSTSETASLHAMMNKYGVDKKDIIMQKHSFDVNDLINKKTDLMASYISNEPYALKQKNVEPIIFHPKDYGFDFYSDILFTSGDEIKNHKERTINFVQASLKGWKYAFNNIDETVELILKKYNSQKKTKEALIYEANELKKLAYYGNEELGHIDFHKLQRIYDIYNVMGLIKNKTDLNKFIFHKDIHRAAAQIVLTVEEKRYLKSHPIIKAHNETSWPPFNFNENGVAKGFSIDYINLLAKKLGIKVEYVKGYSWTQFMDMLQTPALDVIINIVKNKQRAKTISFTDDFYTAQNAIYAHKDNSNFNTLEDLKNKTIAMPKDFFAQKFTEKHYPCIKQILVKDQVEALKLLSLGKVDATIGKKVVMDYIIANNNISGVLATEFIEDKRVISHLRLGTSKQDTILRDILQKIQDKVSDKELRALKEKWFGVKEQNTNELTNEERSYLKNKKVITMCIDPDWMPYEAFDKNGKHRGMTASFFKIFEKNLEIDIKPVITKNWDESLEFARLRKCDILSLAMTTPERKKYMNFTTPYLSIPVVIVTKSNITYIDKLAQLSGRKIGIVKSYALVEIFKKKYPYLDIVEVENLDDGLQKVVDGKIFGFIDNLNSISSKIQTKFTSGIKISGKFDEKWELAVGVRGDDKLLLKIFQKAINNLTSEQMQDVLNKWLSVKVEQVVDYRYLKQIALLFVVFVLIILFWVGVLKKEIQKRKVVEQELSQKNKKLDTYLESIEDGFTVVNVKTKKFITCNKAFEKLTGYSKDELKTMTIDKIHPQKDLPYVFEQFEKQLRGEIIIGLSIPVLHKNQTTVTMCDVNASQYEEDGEVYNIGVFRDITNKLKMENDLKVLNHNLEQKVKEEVEKSRKKDEIMMVQSRHAAMGEMIGMIAHQWRQPITVISMCANNMLIDIEFENVNIDNFKNNAEEIVDETQYLSKTIDDFRNFFKPNKMKELVYIDSVINETIGIIGKSLENNNIELEEVYKFQDCQTYTYSRELLQVFINIIKNAKEALLEKDILSKKITIECICDEKNIKITIEDNAGGIDDKVMKRIFEPYFTTKSEKTGTGLGLYMSKIIVEKHLNGIIEVVNCTDGALFTITLPVIKEVV